MRDYIARDPRTGRPLKTRRRRRGGAELAYKSGEGPWDAIPLARILPLARGDVDVEPVIWAERERLLRRVDAIRALPRIRGRDQNLAHEALQAALGDIDSRYRIAALASLPYCALQVPDQLFEHLHELLDDVDADVRKAAEACLVIVAPVFPSATEETLRRELRKTLKDRRRNAFNALREVAGAWPEVAELHIDELIREEDDELRTEAAALLPRLARHKSATIWDLIGWCLQDEAVTVRRHAARALTPLAEHAPKVAQIALEIAFFDEDDKVRSAALKASRKLDPNSFRMQRLITDGTRHSDRNIRISCIKTLPIILVDAEVRILAAELALQETDAEICALLQELMTDESLEGSEEEKNRFLAPAPKVEMDEGSIATPPPPPPPTAGPQALDKPAKKPDLRQPTQDEIYYGDDFDDDMDDLV